MFEKIFPKIHPEGYKFLAISGVITLILWLMSNFFGFIFGNNHNMGLLLF